MSDFEDDFDPLAPPSDPQLPAEDVVAEDDPLAAPSYDDGAIEADEIDESDGGFSDHHGIVRLWLEGDRLSRVRLSPVWFHKVADAAALEACFRQALLLATLRIAPEPAGDEADTAHEEEFPAEVYDRFRGLPELSRRSLMAFDQLGREMEERHAAALPEPEPKEPAVVSGRSKGVTVTLNDAGLVDRITFDPKWLDDAQVGAICTHIMLAADRAYGKYTPGASDDEVLEEQARERALHRQALLTMFTPRAKRR